MRAASSTWARDGLRTSPRHRHVVAIEPSDVMASQRPPTRAPAIRASAGDLPLRDGSVDAAMAVLTIHHWDEAQQRGVREMRPRRARDRVVVTFDAEVSGRMWLVADYLKEVGELDRRIFPAHQAARGVARRADGGRRPPRPARQPRLVARLVLGASRARPRSRRTWRDIGVRADAPEVVDRVVADVDRDLRERNLGPASRAPADARRVRRGASHRRQ